MAFETLVLQGLQHFSKSFSDFVGVILQVTKKNRVAPRVLFRDVLTNEDLRKEPAGSEGKQLLRCCYMQQQQHRPLHDEVSTPFKERAAPFQIEDENVTQTNKKKNKKKLGGERKNTFFL